MEYQLWIVIHFFILVIQKERVLLNDRAERHPQIFNFQYSIGNLKFGLNPRLIFPEDFPVRFHQNWMLQALYC